MKLLQNHIAEPDQTPHRRRNLLTGEWVLVSPHRAQRPWQGATERVQQFTLPSYDPACYLCPGNERAGGVKNPEYTGSFVFTNDFPALLPERKPRRSHSKMLQSRQERGICRVINYTPRHDRSLSTLTSKELESVIGIWQRETRELGARSFIRSVQIFENRGEMMGNSNPHPHGQIWAQEHFPNEPSKELRSFVRHARNHRASLLEDYLETELDQKERIICQNRTWVVLVPYWAAWPYETLLIPRRRISSLVHLTPAEKRGFADVIGRTTRTYDRVFDSPFPYSAGIHQAPTDGQQHQEWHVHMHFYPPLLRSPQIKKFMVGYEMFGEPQRDITPEESAERLRSIARTLR